MFWTFYLQLRVMVGKRPEGGETSGSHLLLSPIAVIEYSGKSHPRERAFNLRSQFKGTVCPGGKSRSLKSSHSGSSQHACLCSASFLLEPRDDTRFLPASVNLMKAIPHSCAWKLAV